MPAAPLRVGIISSPNGTSTEVLQALGLVKAIVTTEQDAKVLKDADKNGIKATFFPYVKGKKGDEYKYQMREFEDFVDHYFAFHKIDVILLVGCMQVLSDEFIAKWPGKILNIHPSLLPDFAGGMNKSVHQAVLDARKEVSGCTLQFVVPGAVDSGPYLIQSKCRVQPDDTVETLKDRVQDLEKKVLVDALAILSLNPNACKDLQEGRISTTIIQPADMQPKPWQLSMFNNLPKPELPSAITSIKIAAGIGTIGAMAFAASKFRAD